MQKLKRLAKFCFVSLLTYFVLKAPIMLLLTDVLHIHYVLSGAIAGAVLTLANFVPSEWWVWKKKNAKNNRSSPDKT